MLFMNTALWLLLAYMMTISVLRLLLLEGWLVALVRGYQRGRTSLAAVAATTDDRQGSSPISNLAVLAAQFYLTLLLFLIFIFWAAQP